MPEYDLFRKNFSNEKLLNSLKDSFISKISGEYSDLSPNLLINDYEHEKKIVTSIEEELSTCDAFDFSVAFINHSGIACIKQKLDYLSEHNIPGRILTTNYLNFTQPSALKEILSLFPNIELKVYDTEKMKKGFHPKGYIFKQSNYYSIIIGSANLTASALNANQEWSIKFISALDGQIVFSVREEFERIWNQAEKVDEQWISNYEKKYKENQIKLTQITKEKNTEKEKTFDIVPNKMQQEAMASLASSRDDGKNKALLIASTGTGKTYLSIFDVKQMQPKRVLYVAHRDMILHKSEESFKNLLPEIKTGFLGGGIKDFDADFIFASVATLRQDDILQKFTKNHFDYIIIDEVHHAGADSYQKIIDYFTPKFLLGLTATPERTDGFDIYSLFENTIAYEIRLQKALEEDLLCPFHYYGLSDLTVNGQLVDDKTEFKNLVSTERIHHIEKALKTYRSYEYAVKGLIFCSRIEEAYELSKQLNQDGFYTKALCGTDDDKTRERVIEELESDTNPLQYIISVDIFNEGVDIPCVNQIVMLRPTQSSIIFVQQLGRGLRKTIEKKYVSVIDFIGNYENNFFIPIALFSDNSYDKDSIRRHMTSGTASLPGTSSIQINEIAKQRIYESISNAKFNRGKFLQGEYKKLKMRLAHVPSMVDFVDNGFIDPLLFIDYAGSYYEFKTKFEKNIPELAPCYRTSLQFISLEFAHGFRLHELLILKTLLDKDSVSIDEFKIQIEKFGFSFDNDDIDGMIHTLSPDYYGQIDRKKYGELTYIEYSQDKKAIIKTHKFSELLKNCIYKSELSDCLTYGIKRAQIKESEKVENHNLVLYRKYSRKDVCKILNWDKDYSSTIYGYKTMEKTNTLSCPIFVTYEKHLEETDSTNYKDYFIDNTHFNWNSRSRRTSKSKEVAAIIDQKTNKIEIPLFIKKSDAEGSDFYYMGNCILNNYKNTKMNDGDEIVPVVNIIFKMNTPVPKNLYNYLVA